MRKIIGLALWLVALTLPFWWSVLNTDTVIYDDGRADNIKGLLSFVVLVVLLFAGYYFVDSAPRSSDAGHHHGH